MPVSVMHASGCRSGEEVDVGPVVALVVAGLDWHSAGSEAVVGGDQRLGGGWIVDAFADLVGDAYRVPVLGELTGRTMGNGDRWLLPPSRHPRRKWQHRRSRGAVDHEPSATDPDRPPG